MTTIAEVCGALKDTIDTIEGLHVFDYVPESITVSAPVAVIVPGASGRVVINTSRMERAFRIIVAVPKATDRASQALLWEFMEASGSKSILAKLHADQTLGGVVQSAKWDTDGGLTDVSDVLGLSWWGCEIAVQVVYLSGV